MRARIRVRVRVRVRVRIRVRVSVRVRVRVSVREPGAEASEMSGGGEACHAAAWRELGVRARVRFGA